MTSVISSSWEKFSFVDSKDAFNFTCFSWIFVSAKFIFKTWCSEMWFGNMCLFVKCAAFRKLYAYCLFHHFSKLMTSHCSSMFSRSSHSHTQKKGEQNLASTGWCKVNTSNSIRMSKFSSITQPSCALRARGEFSAWQYILAEFVLAWK